MNKVALLMFFVWRGQQPNWLLGDYEPTNKGNIHSPSPVYSTAPVAQGEWIQTGGIQTLRGKSAGRRKKFLQ